MGSVAIFGDDGGVKMDTIKEKPSERVIDTSSLRRIARLMTIFYEKASKAGKRCLRQESDGENNYCTMIDSANAGNIVRYCGGACGQLNLEETVSIASESKQGLETYPGCTYNHKKAEQSVQQE